MYCQKCQVTITASQHRCVERKVCPACGVEKAIQEFPKHPSAFDGHRNMCIPCTAGQKGRDQMHKVQARVQERERREQEQARREQENRLFAAYGYRWRRGLVDAGWGEYEEGWVLHTPAGAEISIQEAHAEIARWQQHHPGHASARWADDLLSLTHPLVLVLDTETTGVDANAEVIEIALADRAGEVYLNTLIECQAATIPQEAMKQHRIHKFHLRAAPTFPRVWKHLLPLLSSHEILIYNADYDMRLLKQTARRYGLELPAGMRTHCLMQHYSAYVGQPSSRAGGYRSMSLAAACYHFGIEQQTAHRALADVEASLEVLHQMSAQAGVKV